LSDVLAERLIAASNLADGIEWRRIHDPASEARAVLADPPGLAQFWHQVE